MYTQSKEILRKKGGPSEHRHMIDAAQMTADNVRGQVSMWRPGSELHHIHAPRERTPAQGLEFDPDLIIRTSALQTCQ